MDGPGNRDVALFCEKVWRGPQQDQWGHQEQNSVSKSTSSHLLSVFCLLQYLSFFPAPFSVSSLFVSPSWFLVCLVWFPAFNYVQLCWKSFSLLLAWFSVFSYVQLLKNVLCAESVTVSVCVVLVWVSLGSRCFSSFLYFISLRLSITHSDTCIDKIKGPQQRCVFITSTK